MSGERSTQSPTMLSGPTPSPRRWCASRLACASSSRVAHGLVRRTPRRSRPACAPPAPRTAPAGSRRGTGRAVSFHAARMVRALGGVAGCRSCRSARPGRPPRPPAAAAAARRCRRRSSSSNRSLAYSMHAVDAGRPCRRPRAARPARTTGRTWRSPPATGVGRAAQPRQLDAGSAGASFWNASITWNSGWRASERAGLSTSTSRSNGSVLVRVGGQVAVAHPAEQLAEGRVAPTCRCAAPAC